MVNRRTILKLGATTVTGVLIERPGLGKDGAAPHPHNTFQRAVFEERFGECRAFAAELNRAGIPTTAIRGDVAKVWYEDLRVHLSRNPAPVAGLTDRAALFCLEELARDLGMRVIFRADHMIQPDGRAGHTAVGLASLVAVTRNLAPERGFGREIARLFRRFGTDGFDVSEARIGAAQKRTGPFSPENTMALVSWVIA